VEHGFAKNCIRQGDITDEHLVINKRYDLVICYDVLEHLSEEKLPVALNNLLKLGRNFIFSIPFLGDPNLDLDSTHKIRRSRNWWLEQLTRSGFDIKETPHHFLFYNQLVIATVKKQDMVVS
jgi:2-polyprenyl-3-methyl-5-hydroxy-6-metoxy-1,4-benzoquinol methylase